MLYHTVKGYGGTDAFWLCVIDLAIRGALVGDIRRYSGENQAAEERWIASCVQKLVSMGVMNDQMCDRLLGIGKYTATTPPLPKEGQLYVLDVCCGYMSVYYDCIKGTNIGYLCCDWKRRLWSGPKHGWLKPHVTADVRVHTDIGKYVCTEAGVHETNCLLFHGSPPSVVTEHRLVFFPDPVCCPTLFSIPLLFTSAELNTLASSHLCEAGGSNPPFKIASKLSRLQ